jgi:hypothetical protein
MKAVLGVLLLLVGFTVAYLVLSGKLPNATGTVVAPTSGGTTTVPTVYPSGTPGSGQTHQSTILGGQFPTMSALDILGSNGGMK